MGDSYIRQAAVCAENIVLLSLLYKLWTHRLCVSGTHASGHHRWVPL